MCRIITILLTVCVTLPLFSQEKNLILEGRSGHAAIMLSSGTHLFSYVRQNEQIPAYRLTEHAHLFLEDQNDLIVAARALFFSSNRHAYSFQIQYHCFVYPALIHDTFSLGIGDHRFLYPWLIWNNEIDAIFRGNYEFAYSGGVTFFHKLSYRRGIGIEPKLTFNFNQTSLGLQILFHFFYLF